MKRLFSIHRRRANYVDLWAPKVVGADRYRLKWASAFSLAPTTVIETSNVGYLDPNMNRAIVDSQPLNGGVRMVFDPASFAIPDLGSFWVQLVPVSGGVEMDPGAMTLVLPPHVRGNSLITIMGTPVGTQQLDLPALRDIRIESNAVVNIAIEESGAIFTAPESPGPYTLGSGQISTLFVSGGAFALSGILAR
jgi:hypothetical protein